MIVPEIVKEMAGKCVAIYYKGLFQGLHVFRLRKSDHGAKIGLPLFIVYNEEKQTAYKLIIPERRSRQSGEVRATSPA